MQIGNKAFYAFMGIVGMAMCAGIAWYRWNDQQVAPDLDLTYMQVDSHVHQKTNVEKTYNYKTADKEDTYEAPAQMVLFRFDPNTASVDDFVKLGLSPKVAQTIINYRNKGGAFYKPEDFKRIYTLKPADFERLLPYIQIQNVPKREAYASNNRAGYTAYQPKTNHAIAINDASAEVWQKQKGIGEGFARRIVEFRTRLGGFMRIEQLKEVYGLPDSTYQNLLPHMSLGNAPIQKLAINKASEQEIAQHPYIGPKMAANIIKLRNDIQKFNKIEDLRMVPLINEEKYRKIAPYLTVD